MTKKDISKLSIEERIVESGMMYFDDGYLGSTNHGVGYYYGRNKVMDMDNIKSEDVKKELDKKGIYLESRSERGIVEEAPQVYKDVDEVVKVSNELGIGKLVCKLRPIGVIKG